MTAQQKPKNLIDSFKINVIKYKGREIKGSSVLEYEVFIPVELMVNQSQDTDNFIKMAKYIKNDKELGCLVALEKDKVVRLSASESVQGIAFVFTFNQFTDFDRLLELADKF
ncbi:hypothetical protein FP73_gp053 [Bacillus phage Hoody T]|uniref:Uncharacterized protein n=1 Tax=Bacillus phage Hoody T TaxID=1486660 RepID=A0A024B1N4_9CAUD|nr:hypothetical protein FP73_gp053 [Bacillus phage Hoody T]AHZ10365.1 hypothetical protein [Bacillus phage Hoody T]